MTASITCRVVIERQRELRAAQHQAGTWGEWDRRNAGQETHGSSFE
jgi:hypothetical protein